MRHHLILFFLGFPLFAQSQNQHDDRPYRNYATQQVHRRLLSENPHFSDRLVAMEKYINNHRYIGNGKTDTIPVVFHVLYAPGQAYPSEAQVQAQLNALNRDFQRSEVSPSSYPVEKVRRLAKLATDQEIYFCLPLYDAAGAPAKPVHYVETNVNEWSADDFVKFSATGGADAWDTRRFLNIWVAYLGENKAGYAQMPGGPSATDGIVLDSRYFINSGDTLVQKFYSQGKTLTHLVGSYLGLYELWNESDPCRDDYVDDTPVHNAPNYIPGDIYYHISLCDTTYQPEMIMNFMDNTDDEVLNMFTPGQKNRMKAVLSSGGPRGVLVSGNVFCKREEGVQVFDDQSFKKYSAPSAAPTMRLFPNPASQTINLELTASQPGNVLCSAVNLLGATVWSDESNMVDESQRVRVDCSSWGEGVYIVTAVFSDGSLVAQKLMITSP